MAQETENTPETTKDFVDDSAPEPTPDPTPEPTTAPEPEKAPEAPQAEKCTFTAEGTFATGKGLMKAKDGCLDLGRLQVLLVEQNGITYEYSRISVR